MPEALQQVRDDLGDQAVILNTRQLRKGHRFNLDDEARVEVTAACDAASPDSETRAEGQAESRLSRGATRPGRGFPLERQRAQSGTGNGAGVQDPATGVSAGEDMVARRYGQARPRLPLPRRASGATPFAPSPRDGRTAPIGPETELPAAAGAQTGPALNADDALGRLTAQLHRLEEVVARAERQQKRQEIMVPDALVRLRTRLGNVGLGGDLLDALVRHLFTEMSGKALADPERVAVRAATFLAHRAPAWRDIRLGRRRKVIGFFGASGSGKTTAAAKIASGFASRHGRGIVLVSVDGPGGHSSPPAGLPGGEDEARTATQVRTATVRSTEDLKTLLEEIRGARLVLLDTPGCGPHDPDGRERLRQLFEAAQVDEVQVVLDARTSLDHMLDQIEAARDMGTRRLLFTKLDETARTGAVLSAAAGTQVPVSYFTTQSGVSTGIEAGNCARLAARLMGISPTAVWTEEGE